MDLEILEIIKVTETKVKYALLKVIRDHGIEWSTLYFGNSKSE